MNFWQWKRGFGHWESLFSLIKNSNHIFSSLCFTCTTCGRSLPSDTVCCSFCLSAPTFSTSLENLQECTITPLDWDLLTWTHRSHHNFNRSFWFEISRLHKEGYLAAACWNCKTHRSLIWLQINVSWSSSERFWSHHNFDNLSTMNCDTAGSTTKLIFSTLKLFVQSDIFACGVTVIRTKKKISPNLSLTWSTGDFRLKWRVVEVRTAEPNWRHYTIHIHVGKLSFFPKSKGAFAPFSARSRLYQPCS